MSSPLKRIKTALAAPAKPATDYDRGWGSGVFFGILMVFLFWRAVDLWHSGQIASSGVAGAVALSMFLVYFWRSISRDFRRPRSEPVAEVESEGEPATRQPLPGEA